MKADIVLSALGAAAIFSLNFFVAWSLRPNYADGLFLYLCFTGLAILCLVHGYAMERRDQEVKDSRGHPKSLKMSIWRLVNQIMVLLAFLFSAFYYPFDFGSPWDTVLGVVFAMCAVLCLLQLLAVAKLGWRSLDEQTGLVGTVFGFVTFLFLASVAFLN